MNKLKKLYGQGLEFVKRRKVVIIALVLIASFIAVASGFGSNGTVDTTSPFVDDLVRTVKIAGRVVPVKSADLAFEISGTVTSVNKEVGQSVTRGQIIARIDSSSILAEIQKAEAELSLAQANLYKLEGADALETQIENAKRSLIQSIIKAHAASEDAVYNKTDPFFSEPNSSRPRIIPTFKDSADLRDNINGKRLSIGETLTEWKTLIAVLNTSNYTEEKLSSSKKYLSEVSSYITEVSRAASLFEEGGGINQSTIDTYKSDTVSARDNLNTSSDNLIGAEEKFKSLLLDVPAQAARVEAARATLLNHRSELRKTSLISPINGIISRQSGKVGQIASPSEGIVSVISKDSEIEAFIPEILISGVSVGNKALVTLDAYGSEEIFKAEVVHLDPAETIKDGVSTYKIKLAFAAADERARPGMTANINIETYRKEKVHLIPERAIFEEDGETFAYILTSDGEKERTSVSIGERDSSGNVELLSTLPPETLLVIDKN